MKLYSHPNCSTCKKAIKFLASAGHSPEIIDLREQAPTVAELERMLEVYAGNVRKLFNTSGMRYRELDMKNQLTTLSADEAVALLAQDGLLVKRPFILTATHALVGFKQDEWSTALT